MKLIQVNFKSILIKFVTSAALFLITRKILLILGYTENSWGYVFKSGLIAAFVGTSYALILVFLSGFLKSKLSKE